MSRYGVNQMLHMHQYRFNNASWLALVKKRDRCICYCETEPDRYYIRKLVGDFVYEVKYRCHRYGRNMKHRDRWYLTICLYNDDITLSYYYGNRSISIKIHVGELILYVYFDSNEKTIALTNNNTEIATTARLRNIVARAINKLKKDFQFLTMIEYFVDVMPEVMKLIGL